MSVFDARPAGSPNLRSPEFFTSWPLSLLNCLFMDQNMKTEILFNIAAQFPNKFLY